MRNVFPPRCNPVRRSHVRMAEHVKMRPMQSTTVSVAMAIAARTASTVSIAYFSSSVGYVSYLLVSMFLNNSIRSCCHVQVVIW